MRAVLQRVTHASVTVGTTTVSSISRGLCILLGIAADDTKEDLDWIVRKILGIKVFDDSSGVMWKQNVMEIDGEVLCVSQFTLYGLVNKGYKPDFHLSMKSSGGAKEMYEAFVKKMGDSYDPSKIKDGVFGAMMVVDIANDGPVTLELDSRKFVYVDKEDNSQAQPKKK